MRGSGTKGCKESHVNLISLRQSDVLSKQRIGNIISWNPFMQGTIREQSRDTQSIPRSNSSFSLSRKHTHTQAHSLSLTVAQALFRRCASMCINVVQGQHEDKHISAPRDFSAGCSKCCRRRGGSKSMGVDSRGRLLIVELLGPCRVLQEKQS